MSTATEVSDSTVEVGGTRVRVWESGEGTPTLVLHGELGLPSWSDAHEQLARDYRLVVPTLPGFGKSDRADHLLGVTDLARWLSWFIREQDLPAPLNVVGSSLGGWAAVELAAFAPEMIGKLVLVSPMGVKPDVGEIWDYMLSSGDEGIRRNFVDPDNIPEYQNFWAQPSREALEEIETNREMVARLAWKPWMHSWALPYFLPSVTTQTLIVHGREDAITPLKCSEMYAEALPNATLSIIDGCGHAPELEKPDEFVQLVRQFLG